MPLDTKVAEQKLPEVHNLSATRNDDNWQIAVQQGKAKKTSENQERPNRKAKHCGEWGLAQQHKHVPGKHEVTSSIPGTKRQNKTQRQRRKKKRTKQSTTLTPSNGERERILHYKVRLQRAFNPTDQQ